MSRNPAQPQPVNPDGEPTPVDSDEDNTVAPQR